MRIARSSLKSLTPIACLILAALALCGCALGERSSPSEALGSTSATYTTPEPPATTADAAPEAKPAESPPAAKTASTAPATNSSVETPPNPPRAQVDPRMMQRMMTDLHGLRELDPAGHDQLLTDLSQVDPKLWPMLVQGFKASLDYRQRKSNVAAPAVASPPPAAPVVAAVEPAKPLREQPSNPPPARTVSHEAPKPAADWRQSLQGTIRSLEASLAEAPAPAEDDRHVQLRLLYLLAGERDKALQPVTGQDALAQEFWSRELYSLSAYLDAQRVTDRSRRAAEAAVHHWEASHRLSQQGNLLVRNLALCTEVMSYGVYTPFERLEFTAGQPIVLYAEVENFISQASARGHHTSFNSSYQIFDSRGQKVDQHDFPPMEEYCHNPRRDFFIAYEAIRLPAQIYDGKYTLKLTIEDTLGKKVGQSSIDFQIKATATSNGRSR